MPRVSCRKRTHNPFASTIPWGYDYDVAKLKKFGLEDAVPVVTDDEDKQTLAAIDEGIRDAAVGNTVSSEAVRKLVPQWITASGTRKKR